MDRVEESWTLVGVRHGGTWRCRRLRYRRGQPASVTADGRWALAREESRGDILGFMHTHPMGGLAPSARDVRTMRAWCDALGKSLLCVIATPSAIGAWRFDDYRGDGMRLASVELVGKSQLIGVESNGRKVSSRAALPRRGPAGQARGPAHHAVRRGGRRLEPR
jgi:hypothetical protein